MSTDSAAFDNAKAFLMKSGDEGSSLFDHIGDVLLKVLEERPADALSQFESLSAQVKQSNGTTSKVDSSHIHLCI